MMSAIRLILTDIEGTTSSISFVHEVLFPYAKQHLPAYVRARSQEPAVRAILAEVRDTVITEENRPIGGGGIAGGGEIDDERCAEVLLHWMAIDRKHPALKRLQGVIWRDGYEQNLYKGHVYADVPAALARWQSAGYMLGVYSSGSVEAQQLLFAHTAYGDLTPCFSAYFDTQVGHKREVASYRHIAQRTGVAPSGILFLSDIQEELDAARTAGFQTVQLLRDDFAVIGDHRTAASFEEIL